MVRYIFLLMSGLFVTTYSTAQQTSNHGNKFEQLGSILPTPNNYRNMGNFPGPDYWQQRVHWMKRNKGLMAKN